MRGKLEISKVDAHTGERIVINRRGSRISSRKASSFLEDDEIDDAISLLDASRDAGNNIHDLTQHRASIASSTSNTLHVPPSPFE